MNFGGAWPVAGTVACWWQRERPGWEPRCLSSCLSILGTWHVACAGQPGSVGAGAAVRMGPGRGQGGQPRSCGHKQARLQPAAQGERGGEVQAVPGSLKGMLRNQLIQMQTDTRPLLCPWSQNTHKYLPGAPDSFTHPRVAPTSHQNCTGTEILGGKGAPPKE